MSLKKKPKLSAIGHGLSALEQVDIHDDIYGDDIVNNVGYDTFITHSDDDNTHKKAPQPHRPTKQRARSKDGSLPMRGFSVCSLPDNYQYDLKQQIRANNHHQNRNNFKSNYDGYKQFSSDKMQIDKEFVHKFANFDLTVGSFLCRNIKHSQKKVLTDSASQIPDFIPNAQLQFKENVSQHLNDNFTVTETMIGGEDMDGLRAGLTLAQHIPSKHNQLRKAHAMLEDIRQVYGGQNAEKLARFDVFLAGKLCIESPVDIRDSLLYSDGNKTAHELNQELCAFEKEWLKLQPYAVYIYPDKERMHGTQSGNKVAVRNYNCKQAARQNMYGALTRSVEMWLPDRLLCKRCNIRDPYHGMYDDGNKRKAVKRCNEVSVSVIESKGEHIAAMLRENESDKQPAILELKQLKTWNLYLRETPDGGESSKMERDPEMKSFVDGILNECESGGDGEGAVEEDTLDKRKEFSLFKSIFEDDQESESESESECEEEEESDYCEMITKVDVDNEGNGEEEESVHIAKKRKKFKFVAKADRKSNVLSSRFGAIGFMDQRRNMNESVDGKRGLDPEVKPAQLQLHHDSDGGGDIGGVCVENEVKPHDGMVWAVLDNESSEYNESDHDIDHNDRMKNKKKKKRKRKEKKSKKHKSKRKKSKTKKKHKYKS